MRSIAPLACVLAVLGCTRAEETPPPAASAPPPPAQEVTYVCGDGPPAVVTYQAGGVISLNYDGAVHAMNPAPATSGSRWVGETLEWRILLGDGGETATLARTDAPPGSNPVLAQCVRSPQGAPLAPDPQGRPTSGTGCRADSLSLQVVSEDAGAGSRYATLAFRNDGTQSCTLQGYPGIALIGANGQPRNPFRFEQSPFPYYAEGETPGPVTLAPGAQAYFDLITTAVAGEVEGETEPCPAVTAVRAEPPGSAGAVQATIDLNPCNQRARVTPFRPVAEPSR